MIHGGADTVVDPRNADLLTELIPGAQAEVVPERGHLLIWEEAELLAPVVREFLHS